MNLSIRDLARVGGLLAAAFVLKLPILGLPNIEPFTLVYFFIGYRYGLVWGIVIAGLGEFLYSAFNPFGAALPPVMVAQVVGMGIVGLCGGLFGHYDSWRVCSHSRRWGLLAVAICLTLVFDLLTNLAMVWTLGNLVEWLYAAIPFSALHIAANSVLFVFAFPVLQKLMPDATETAERYR